MSIATELNRIIQAKSDIITSLTAKGATVPSGATIDDLPDIIDDLPSGGGGDTEALKDLIERDITSITIPAGTTKIGPYAFAGCSGFTNITIPNTVTSIGHHAFSGCSGLTSVTIPNTVSSISTYTFSECAKITSAILPDSITEIGNSMFYTCSSLSSVNIPDTVTSLGNACFYGCALTDVILPSGLTLINNQAFAFCRSLASVTVLATTPPTLANTNAFGGNASGRKFYVPASSVETYKAANNWSTYAADIEAIPSA